ncbi:MAG: hypothetical protein FWD47_11465 [Treponema sp.]|nr:hypothetical protein [Treponema sp.]
MMISTDEINWFFNRPSDLLDCKGWTRNQFIHFAIDVCDLEMIKWIFEHSKELKTTKRKLGKRIFRRAIKGSSNGGYVIKEKNIDYPLLYWLHDNINIADLYKGGTTIRLPLFLDIFCSDGISYKLLDWLVLNIPDLFKGIDDKGKTFFHYAALITITDVIEWFYAHLPELAHCKDKDGNTPYDISINNGNTAVANWISNNIPVIQC